jgi:hypothetical protein
MWALALVLFPASAGAQSRMNEAYETLAETWATNARPYAIGLASALVALDISMILLAAYRDRDGIQVVFGQIVKRVFLMGLAMTLFLNPKYFAFPLIEAFESAGTAIGGGGTAGLPDPTVVLLQGWDAFTRLINAIFIPPEASDPNPDGITGVLGVLKDFFLWVWYIVSLGAYLLGVGVAALVLLAGFVILGLQILLGRSQSLLFVSLGLFFVGMIGSSLTQGLFSGYARMIVQAGVRLFFLSALFGGYYILLPAWESGIAEGLAAIPRGPNSGSTTPPSVAFRPLLETTASVVLFTYLVWKIPGALTEILMREFHPMAARGNAG